MALTDVEKIRLEIGLLGDNESVLSDDELQYFLDKNSNNVKRACLDSAKTILFILSQLVHERSGTELEIWNHTRFENYLKVLQMYIDNPAFSIKFDGVKFYAGGISKTDIRNNIDDMDNLVLDVDIGIPKDGVAINSTNTNKDIFSPYNIYYDVMR